MGFLDAVILGIVEGFTEFLPISSTAHLVLGAKLLEVPESAFLSSFVIAIQLGAIMSVVILYWQTLIFDREMLLRIAIAFLPTGVIGFLLYKLLKDYLLDNLMLIASALLIGGAVLVVFEYFDKRETTEVIPEDRMPLSTAFWIGCIQALAIIPGVSRAGATILGGLMLGVSRKEIVEFSFLLAIPTMVAATGYDLLKTGSTFAYGEWELLAVGFIVSFIAAYAGVRFLVSYIQTHSFTVFGLYRVVLGAVIIAFILF